MYTTVRVVKKKCSFNILHLKCSKKKYTVVSSLGFIEISIVTHSLCKTASEKMGIDIEM